MSNNTSANFEFKDCMRSVVPLLAKEGIRLDFTGYDDTISEFYQIDGYELNEIFELDKNLMAWKEYLKQIEAVVTVFQNSKANQLTYLEAFKTKRKNNKLEGMMNETIALLKLLKNAKAALHREIMRFQEVEYVVNKIYFEGTKNYIKK